MDGLKSKNIPVTSWRFQNSFHQLKSAILFQLIGREWLILLYSNVTNKLSFISESMHLSIQRDRLSYICVFILYIPSNLRKHTKLRSKGSNDKTRKFLSHVWKHYLIWGRICGQQHTPPNFRVCARQKVPAKLFKIWHILYIR